MANYANLKATINANIKANGNEEITGPILNTVLNQAVTTLGAGYQYMGVATPATSPGTPDANVFYIAATPGTYTNFGGKVVADGEVAILKYNGSWTKEVSGAATAAQVTQLGREAYYAFFTGAGNTLSYNTIRQLVPGRSYCAVIKNYNWDTTGVTSGSYLFQIASWRGTTSTNLVSIPLNGTREQVYKFTIPSNSERVTIGGRAAIGENVYYYIYDIEDFNEIRQSIGMNTLAGMIESEEIEFVQGKIDSTTGAHGASPTRIHPSVPLHTECGYISVPDGFLIADVFYYTAWTSESSFTFAMHEQIKKRLLIPNTTYPLVRFTITRTTDTYNLSVEQFLTAFDNYIPQIYKDGPAEQKARLDTLSGGNVPISTSIHVGSINASGAIVNSTSYRYTDPIQLKPGWTIAVESKGYNFSPISKTDSTGTRPYTVITFLNSGDTTTLHKYTYKNLTSEVQYIVLSYRFEDGVISYYFDDGFNKVAELDSSDKQGIPETITLEATTYVSTARNYILKNEMVGGVDTLLYSKDCGLTWASTPNTIGDIVFVHWFADGTCLIAGNNAVYTTTDGLTFTPSTILDENGNNFTPSYNAFYRLGNYDSPYYEVNGKEVLIWNDYGISSGYVSRIWYSEDNGATIKCICADNITQDIHNVVINPRHFHRTFVDKDGVLWVTSGDAGVECMLIRGVYSNGAWSFEILASGNEWKLGQFWISGPYAYAVTDYTAGDRPTGIIRWPLSKIADSTAFEYVVKIPNDPPLSSYFEDNAGTKIILPDGIGYKKFYMARHNYQFNQVDISMANNVAPMCLIGPNYNGECIVEGIAGYNENQPFKLNHLRYLFSDGLRGAGVTDFASVNKITG